MTTWIESINNGITIAVVYGILLFIPSLLVFVVDRTDNQCTDTFCKMPCQCDLLHIIKLVAVHGDAPSARPRYSSLVPAE